MPINKFDGDLFIEKLNEPKYDSNLLAIMEAWSYLNYWQRKKLCFVVRLHLTKKRACEKWEAWRAVIVPAGRDLPAWGQLFATSNGEERTDMVVLMLRKIERRKRRAVIVCALGDLCPIMPPIFYTVFLLLAISCGLFGT